MMQEDYVSFEISKLLKEKGFDIECQCCYTPKEYIRNLLTDANNVKIQDFNSLTEFEYEGIGLKGWYGSISAPTIQMAMKWLREVHNRYIEICTDFAYNSKDVVFRYTIFDKKLNYLWESDNYSTYEDACEAAIKYSLENLI